MVLALPSAGFGELELLPRLGITFRRSEGGLVVTGRKGDPYFAGRITTGRLSVREHKVWRAFLSHAVDTNQSIDFIHPRGRWPAAYAAATDYPGADTASVEDFPDLRTAEVAGLEIGTLFTAGDLVGFEQDNLRVARWISADTEVESALSQAVPVTPRLPVGLLAAGCTIRLIDPVMRLRVVPDSWDATETYGDAPISFDVMEALA